MTVLEIGKVTSHEFVALKNQLETYKEDIRKVKGVVRPLSEEKFQAASVKWNGIRFKGTRQEFLSLLDYELESAYIHKTWKNKPSSAAEKEAFKKTFRDAFPKDEKVHGAGNIILKPYYFFVAHGSPQDMASILGKNWRVKFPTVKKVLKNLAKRTGHPVVFCSCYSNTKRLPEKISLSGGEHVWAKKLETEAGRKFLSIMVDQLGKGLTEGGWKQGWEISVWRYAPDDPNADLKDHIYTGDVTEEKTITP